MEVLWLMPWGPRKVSRKGQASSQLREWVGIWPGSGRVQKGPVATACRIVPL